MRAICTLILLGSMLALAALPTGAQEAVPRFRHADPQAETPDAKSFGVIRFLADEDFPPFSYRNGAGALTGYSVALVGAMCDAQGLSCQFAAKPWDELLPTLKAGKADVLISGHRLTPALLEQADATRPYFRPLARFAVLKDTPLAEASQRALAGKRIGVVAASVHEAWLKENFRLSVLRPFPDLAEAQKALRQGSVDALFADWAALSFWVVSPASDGCCRLADGSYAQAESLSPGLSLIIRKDAGPLRGLLDHGLDEMESSGASAGIFRRFFPESPW